MEQSNIKMLVYGKPGVGKTVFLSTAGDDKRTSPVLFLDFESGVMSIQSKITTITVDELKELTDKVPGNLCRIKIREWKDLDDVLDYLYGTHPFKSVCIDSLTEINYLNLRECVELQGKMRTKNDPAELQEYMRSNTQMRRLIREFRDLDNVNVFLSSQLQEDKDDTTGLTVTKPNLVGKLSYEVSGLLDVVGLLSVDYKPNSDGTRSRYMLFAPDKRTIVKDRTEGGKLGIEVENPTVTTIMNLREQT